MKNTGLGTLFLVLGIILMAFTLIYFDSMIKESEDEIFDIDRDISFIILNKGDYQNFDSLITNQRSDRNILLGIGYNESNEKIKELEDNILTFQLYSLSSLYYVMNGNPPTPELVNKWQKMNAIERNHEQIKLVSQPSIYKNLLDNRNNLLKNKNNLTRLRNYALILSFLFEIFGTIILSRKKE